MIPQIDKNAHQGEFGLNRAKYFLKLLDNPQNKVQIIHIAGTSGKGSTSYLISLLLTGLGFKTGLSVSPHLLDIRERAQINDQLIPQEKYLQYLNQLVPIIEQVKASRFGSPTYFDLLMVLAFFIFHREQVDYGVIETKMGGLLDYSNTVSNPSKIAVITRLGFDHTHILGKTLRQIAYQKAGIIGDKNTAIVLEPSAPIKKVIQQVANNSKAQLVYIKQEVNFRGVSVKQSGTIFDFSFNGLTLSNLHLSLLGAHQAENCSLALSTVYLLSQRNHFLLTETVIRKCLARARFRGRIEVFSYQGKQIICDGAHNPQKMQVLIATLKALYPDQRFDFLLAFKKSKDYYQMLKIISPWANRVLATGFFQSQSYSTMAEDPRVIKAKTAQLGIKRHTAILDQSAALAQALAAPSPFLVITGSLYFLSEIYPQLSSLRNN